MHDKSDRILIPSNLNKNTVQPIESFGHKPTIHSLFVSVCSIFEPLDRKFEKFQNIRDDEK